MAQQGGLGEIAPRASGIVARERFVGQLRGAASVDRPTTWRAVLQALMTHEGVADVEDVHTPGVVTGILRCRPRTSPDLNTAHVHWRNRRHLQTQ